MKNHGSCDVTAQEPWLLCCHSSRTMAIVLLQHENHDIRVVTTQVTTTQPYQIQLGCCDGAPLLRIQWAHPDQI